jgi:N utilization substance protein B
MNDQSISQALLLNTQPVDNELPEIKLQPSADNHTGGSGMSRRDERVLAFHFLYAAEQCNYNDSLASIVAMFREGFEVEVPEGSYAIELAQHVIDAREELDKQLLPVLKNWRLERLGCCTHLILRLALYELMQPDAIPNIIINEAVELAKGFAEKDAYRFINGILDEFVKSQKASQEEES